MRTLVYALLSLMATKAIAQNYYSADHIKKDQSELKAVVFLSANCPCSRSHIEHLNKLEKEYKNLKIFGVITDDMTPRNLEKIKSYYSKERFSFPIIEDPKQTLIKYYRALKTPHVVLLRKTSNKDYKKIYQGGVSDQRDFTRSKKKYLEENLLALDSGTSLPYQQGRSLGCYIRRF